ncbi:hypothetical protein WKI68_39955 [Streptomyces sp. MS1.HAVA.3]|uniref:Uncharacterized protein n=1 Tax=Streptomyces caledonius TaxID=3134107 RepID=A0ABU8UDZ3_9ACTN
MTSPSVTATKPQAAAPGAQLRPAAALSTRATTPACCSCASSSA